MHYDVLILDSFVNIVPKSQSIELAAKYNFMLPSLMLRSDSSVDVTIVQQTILDDEDFKQYVVIMSQVEQDVQLLNIKLKHNLHSVL